MVHQIIQGHFKGLAVQASSAASNLMALGVNNKIPVIRFKSGPWYNHPCDYSTSCCSFHVAAHEFECQGLELDLPIVCWGDDFYRSHGRWEARTRRSANLYRDPYQLRLNSYRVLLTRGRDGFVVFIPRDGSSEMEETAAFLLAAGMTPLSA